MRLLSLIACFEADDDAARRWPEVEAQAGLAACVPEPPGLTEAIAVDPPDPAAVREALRAWHRADPAAVTRPTDLFRWFDAWYCEECPPVAPDDAAVVLHVGASMARCGGHAARAVADALVFTACDLDPGGTRAVGTADPERFAEAWSIPGTVARDAVEIWTVADAEQPGNGWMKADLREYLVARALDTPLGIPPAPTVSRYWSPLVHVVYMGAAGLFEDAARRDIARDRCLSGPPGAPFAVAQMNAVGVLLATDDPEVGLLRVSADSVLGVPDREEGVPYPAPVDVGDLGHWWALDTQGVIGPVSAPAARVLTTCENDGGVHDWLESTVSLRLLARRPEPETAARVLAFVVPYPVSPWQVGQGPRLAFEPLSGSPLSAAIEERMADPADCDGPDPAAGVALRVQDERFDLGCCGP
ncbi:MAG: hypothetical protein H0V89_13990 [Deltaproteobacteria bacterium]|nr:hypothetical protein [Deltaproteobacteria bacterium]